MPLYVLGMCRSLAARAPLMCRAAHIVQVSQRAVLERCLEQRVQADSASTPRAPSVRASGRFCVRRRFQRPVELAVDEDELAPSPPKASPSWAPASPGSECGSVRGDQDSFVQSLLDTMTDPMRWQAALRVGVSLKV